MTIGMTMMRNIFVVDVNEGDGVLIVYLDPTP